ncbi:carbohydrate-binding protein [Flammeovirga pectinis]|uniref:Carbohydrate-binding protein n=1 Tax=Flammeovirga pectinis TaxID=2494373 RepID=A0A3S9P8A4_9BACT|nr:carbohydrate-binding protein [Flammeovirga pectinis]AZQ64282.1 carbohydrate-binding protein [Flammeovirga pectinis]
MKHTTKLKNQLLIVLLFLCSNVNAQNFTFGTIPDTQNLSEFDSDAWKLMGLTGWYVEQRQDLNLSFVASLGDMTQWGDYGQWQRVRSAYDLFKDNGMPYAPCQGNHDPQLDRFNQYFPESEFIGTPTYGGNFNGMENAYYLFSEAGMDFIVVTLQTHDNYIGDYDLPSINWANDILNQYADRRAIFITHDFFEERGLINDVIKQHDNLFLAICGHSCSREEYWTETSPSGNTVNCIMTDYQCDDDKGTTLRYYTFVPEENRIDAFTYNTLSGNYETDANSQFSINYQMESLPCELPHQAYNGNVVTLPGTFEAENYNEGCPSIPFYDTDDTNQGGEYRTDAVDIEVCTDGGFNVGWTEAGEWLNYQVNVTTSGTYNFDFKIAAFEGGGSFHLEVDDIAITETINVTSTDGWQSWSIISSNDVLLNSGIQNIKLVIDQGGFNIDNITATSVITEIPPSISLINNTPTSPKSTDDITISATITDNSTVVNAEILWNNQVSVLTNNGDVYSGVIPAQVDGTIINYQIKATDNDGLVTITNQQSITVNDPDINEPQLIWSDEFNYTGLPDPSKWGYDVGNGGYGNNELQNYTENRLENARVENGHLIIEARRDWHQNIEYSSARLVTKNKGDWLYGRVDVSAKLPGGKGTWAAIWMLPTDWEYGGWPDSGEIDIMENVGYDPNTVHGTVHTEAYNHRIGTQLSNSIDKSTYQSEFHSYSVEWTEDKMDFFIDGEKYFTHLKHGGSPEWPFDKRFHLILNLAVGGDWGGALGVDSNIWPQRMEVDYVRVYDKGSSQEVVTTTLPGRLEAENYSDAEGIQKETCSEGGQNVGYISSGDWLKYNVDVTTAGSYLVEYRVASNNGGGQLNLEQNSGNTILGSVTIPTTGGWQTWTTVSDTVQLTAGEQNIAIGIPSGGFNINWIQFTAITDIPNNVTPIRIEAEAYSIMDGLQKETCSEGGENIGYTDQNDWAVYDVEIPAGNYEVSYRFAAMNSGGEIQLEKAGGGGVFAKTAIGSTGGWQTWSTVSDQISITEPISKIAINIRQGGFNLNWIELVPQSSNARSIASTSTLKLEETLRIYPIPATNKLTISNFKNQIVDLNAYSLDGKKHLLDNSNNTIDISSLKKGIYILQLIDDKGKLHTKKFIKE